MPIDDTAEKNLLSAIRAVNELPWKEVRRDILWKSLEWHCQALKLEIIKLELEQPKNPEKKP